MTKEFTTSLGERYKVSINFRSHSVRVWTLFHNKWIKHLKCGYLSTPELLEIAYDLTANDFKQFLKTDVFTIWRY